MKAVWLKSKEWWANLAYRERQAVVFGGAAAAIFIAYQWIWTPYLGEVAILRKRMVTDQELVQWMQVTDQEIRQIENQTKAKPAVVSPVVFLGWMQKQIDQVGLRQSLKQLKEVNNGSIEMHFQAADFDKLMSLCITVVEKQNVSISQMSVLAGNMPGIVHADLVLKLSYFRK